MPNHLFIPDTQVTPDTDTAHIKAAGKLALKRKPEVIVFIGDWWDFESLNSHQDRGNIHYHNKLYVEDLQAGIDAMELFLKPIEQYNARRRKSKMKQYKPRLVFTCGNHEYRRNRLEDDNPKIKGALPTPEQYLWDKGFEVFPFKQAVTIDGITYCHYCPQTSSAGAVSRAHLIAQKRASSWSVGHSQILDYYVSAHLPRIQCLIAGSFYTHDESYKIGSNDHWRGLVYKHDVENGHYDPEFVGVERLLKEFG